MKIMIAGVGSIGRRHLKNLLALGETDLVLYRTRQSTLPDDEFSSFPVETDLAAALAHDPQAVIISNPTALHLDVAIPSAQRGCHLLIEKPISHTPARLDELNDALSNGGGRALVGYHFRFHPALRQIRQKISDGSIGRPLSVRAHWGEYLPDWHPWEDYHLSYSARSDLGGGVILTLSHPLDYLRWIFGEVNNLWAMSGTGSGLGIPVEDQAEIGLRFASGMLGSVHLDYLQRPPAHWLECIGTTGTLHWDNNRGLLKFFRVEVGEWQDLPMPSGFERNDLFMAEMRHFLEVCRGEANPICPLEDGIMSLDLALAAIASQEQGKLIEVKKLL